MICIMDLLGGALCLPFVLSGNMSGCLIVPSWSLSFVMSTDHRSVYLFVLFVGFDSTCIADACFGLTPVCKMPFDSP